MGFSFRRAWIASTALALVLASGRWAIAGEASPGQLPAVSGVNGKVDILGADLNSENFWAASGSLSFPVTHSFGVQLDGMLADYSANPVWGTGGHAFWRDPEIGLLGVVGSRADFFNGTIVNRYGVEGEVYLGQFTLAGTVGYQTGNSRHTGWGGLDLRYYPINNLMLEVGGSAISGERAGHIGFEWQPVPENASGLALFSDASIGTSDYDHIMAGVRWYFGANKPLQSRHREDDPLNMLIQGGSSAVSGTGGKSLGGTRGSGKSGSKSGTSGPVGGGAGGGCFIAGSQVLMKDGSIKPIEEVQIGEMVRGADGAANRVEKLIRPKLGDQLLYSINGGAHFVTDDHPFMTKAGWKAINPAAAEKTNPGLVVGALAVGDVLLTENGETPVQSIGATTGAPETQLYNFTVSGNRTFFIRPTGGENFLLVHNKGCFIAGTEVLMEDGSFKVIENVQIGDKLLGADGIYNEAIKVSIIAIGERKLYSVNGSAAFVTDSHPLMTTDGWKSLNPDLTAKGNGSLKIGKLSIGDAMVTRAGYVRVELLELQEENSDFMVVDLKVSGNGTYYVKDPMTENEFLAHNE